MALTGYEIDINLPAPDGQVRGGFLDAASQIPPDALIRNGTSRFPLGVQWIPWGTNNLDADPTDCDIGYLFSANEPVVREPPAILLQPGFLVWDALTCSTLSVEDTWLRERVVRNLRVYASAAFASELATATASGGLPISGDNIYTPTVLNATAQTTRVAMYEAENHLGGVLHGAQGMIHVSAGLLGLLVSDELVMWDGAHYRSCGGHVVVGDPGWTGLYTPFGSSAAAGYQEWIYATAPVWFAISGINTTDVLTDDPVDTDLLRNVHRPIAQRYGLVTWDPSATGAVKVTIA